jgi:hypothetical protein
LTLSRNQTANRRITMRCTGAAKSTANHFPTKATYCFPQVTNEGVSWERDPLPPSCSVFRHADAVCLVAISGVVTLRVTQLPSECSLVGRPKLQRRVANQSHRTPVRAIQGTRNAAPVQCGTPGKLRNRKAIGRLRRNRPRVPMLRLLAWSCEPVPSASRVNLNHLAIKTWIDRIAALQHSVV